MSASASASASAADGGTDNDNLAIDSRHHSKSHKRGIHAGIAAYDKYAAGHKPALPPLAQTPAAIFCDKRNMQKFAHYLVYTALAKGSKEPLSESTVDNYLSAVMNATKERFSETHGEFFLVLGGRNSSITTPNNWLQQLSFNVGNLIRKRDIERGCELEEDTPGLSRTALVEIVGAYFACNTPDAMYRRFVLQTIWAGVGRVAECTMLNYDLIKWDHDTGLLWTPRRTACSRSCWTWARCWLVNNKLSGS